MKKEGKTKKAIIAKFLESSTENDPKKAFENYLVSGIPKEDIASQGLFQFMWVKVKGKTPKVEKSKGHSEETRAKIAALYKEQEKHMNAMYANKISARLEEDLEKKKELLRSADKSLDAAALINRSIQSLLNGYESTTADTDSNSQVLP